MHFCLIFSFFRPDLQLILFSPRELYLSLGEEKTAELFVRLAPGENPDFPDGHDDKTHFNAAGADRICALVAEGMRRIPVCIPFMK